MIKTCVICGREFKSYPSEKKVTCTKECKCERARRASMEKVRKWGDTAKARLKKRRQTENLKKGTAAALNSPISGPFESNINTLIWTIVSPEGITYRVRNLSLWIRQNAHTLPGTPEQAHAGFAQIKRCMQGKTKRTVTQWKGWRLIGWDNP